MKVIKDGKVEPVIASNNFRGVIGTTSNVGVV